MICSVQKRFCACRMDSSDVTFAALLWCASFTYVTHVLRFRSITSFYKYPGGAVMHQRHALLISQTENLTNWYHYCFFSDLIRSLSTSIFQITKLVWEPVSWIVNCKTSCLNLTTGKYGCQHVSSLVHEWRFGWLATCNKCYVYCVIIQSKCSFYINIQFGVPNSFP